MFLFLFFFRFLKQKKTVFCLRTGKARRWSLSLSLLSEMQEKAERSVWEAV